MKLNMQHTGSKVIGSNILAKDTISIPKGNTIDLSKVGSNVMAAINSKSTEIMSQELWDIYNHSTNPDISSGTPFDYVATLMTDPDVAHVNVIGGGIQIYCVGTVPDYDPDNPNTNTLLKLDTSYQETGSDINGDCYGGATCWWNEDGVIVTDGMVSTPAIYVIVLKPLIFDR